ncbi:hypothetical protein ZWY2020_023773 [Hordeum vulgare]|nr:hypothetical protein ZWY2020_023773 [Hordeum vulgare]
MGLALTCHALVVDASTSNDPAIRNTPYLLRAGCGGRGERRTFRSAVSTASSVSKADNKVDRLSKLPDDVLLNIAGRLDITDIARTTILSRRWKQIPAMLSKIIITVGPFEAKHGRRKLTSRDVVRSNATVLEATRRILESRTGSLYTIHLITVANTMATQKLASVELIILTEVRTNCYIDDLLSYGKRFMSFLDSCPNAFGGLARLWLENLRLGESDFSKIFVEHPQPRELVISGSNLERVDLKWVPKLVVLKFNLQTVSIINIGLSWHKMLKLSELLGKTAISNLHLNFRCEKVNLGQTSVPVFRKLSLVNLFNISEECDLTWTMFILQSAPILKELCIMVRDDLCEVTKGKRRYMHEFSEEKDNGLELEPSAPDFKHHNLAELSIYGFNKGMSSDVGIRFPS